MSDINNFDEEKYEEMSKPEENLDFPEIDKVVPEENIIEGDAIEENISKESSYTGNEEVPFKADEKEEKTKHRKTGRAFSYIAVGLICAMIGGVSGSVSTYYLNSKETKTESNIAGLNNAANDTAQNAALTKTTSATSTTELTVPDVVSKVASSVVGISITSIDGAGYGSGIIISQDGYILTNYHVIGNAKSVKVDFTNGKSSDAKIINYDSALDVAIIKVTDKTNIPAVAELGDSSTLRVGDTAIAIGNPLGKQLQNSVTVGVISALDRDIAMENESQKLIQTDAAINEGNSGGALVNTKGQVIGINVAKIGGSQFSSTQAEGLGFAIPINQVKPKINDLLKPLLMIGIEGSDITDDLSKQKGIPVGIYVITVQHFSSAELAGLQIGDVITGVDGTTIKTVAELNSIKLKHKAGDRISLSIIRDGSKKTLNLTLKTAQ